MDKYILMETQNISKTFPGVRALNKVSLQFKTGEVHAIIGENGAGKSTLMNILSGVYLPDPGSRIIFRGSEVEFHSTADAFKHKIAMIHQENSLVQHLTVYENIYLGHFIAENGFVDKNKMKEGTFQLLKKLHLEWIKPETYVKNLSPSEKQMIEIVKALSNDPDLIIFDEPTAALSLNETEILMNIIRGLRQNNKAVVFISHHLEEIFEIADVISVLRDGNYVGTYDIHEIDTPKLISLMVGRKLDSNMPRKTAEEISARAATLQNPVVLEAKDFCLPEKVKHVSFELHKGEVLGFAGLVGAGRTELMECIFGYRKPEAGELFLDGKKVHFKSPRDAVLRGIGMLSEDRKYNGILPLHSVRDNINSASWNKLCKFGPFVSALKEKQNAKEYIEKLRVKTSSPEVKISSLSGGNQQKVLLARILSIKPRILILDEPTHGVDVGAKEEIYEIINEMSRSGISIILISSELPELIKLSHRIIVMHEGKITGKLEFSEFSQEEILTYASGTGKNNST